MGRGASRRVKPAASADHPSAPFRTSEAFATPFQRQSVSSQRAKWASASSRARKGQTQRELAPFNSRVLFGTPKKSGYSSPDMLLASGGRFGATRFSSPEGAAVNSQGRQRHL